MNKVSPIDLRKAMMLVDTLKDAGIGFVPVPYFDEHGKKLLLDKVTENMNVIRSITDKEAQE